MQRIFQKSAEVIARAQAFAKRPAVRQVLRLAALAAFTAVALVVVQLYGKVPDIGKDGLAVEAQANPNSWFKTERDLTVMSRDVRASAVQSVVLSPSFALVTLKSGARYYVNVAEQWLLVSKLLEDQMKNGAVKVVNVAGIAPPASPMAHALAQVDIVRLFNVGMPILMLGLLGVMAKQLLGDMRRFSLEKRPKGRFADVIGAAEAKAALQDIQSYLRRPDRFVAMGAKPPRGRLLVGPPGTGKTKLARALAGECGANVICLSGSDFTAKFLGVGVARVKSLFALAKKHAPCIVFIDEADAIGQRSNGGGGAAETENNRIIDAILVEMDGFRATDGVIVIFATNHPDNVDKALLRSGRIDRTVFIALPTVDERENLFEFYGKKLKLAEGVDFRQLARLSSGRAPADIESVVNDAAVLAVNTNAQQVTHQHLMAALEQHQMGAPAPERKKAMQPETVRRVSVHEAGHAIVAAVLNLGVVEKVTNMPHGAALGVTLVTEQYDPFLLGEDYLHDSLAMYLGGRVAEKMVTGTVSTGAQADLEEVTKRAYKMVAIWGMSYRIGAVSVAGLPESEARSMQADVLTETRGFVEQAERRCETILNSHRRALDALAAALDAQETVPGEVVYRCIAEANRPNATELATDVEPAPDEAAASDAEMN
ncbi:AAA family ATPase [Paraburkholderia sp. UCT31]|uniref:AAA family ATPase n=1 Tax=Paraburkholderia sp. UCT31 TaxID=2615209 RepID=UPI0016553E16|nr:AAA family ATPase [Paraburkholderia sp. UCT31]MBC8738523.1 AAA family ATPase [Paraburkholderia sp. UCT31]